MPPGNTTEYRQDIRGAMSENSHLIWTENKLTGFYYKWNISGKS